MPDPIDTEHLEKYVAGDTSLRDEILTIFQEQIATLREKLNNDADDEQWFDTLHALKGASRGVGAWHVGDLCEKAEALVGDGADKHAKRQDSITELEAHLDLVVKAAMTIRDES